MSKQKNNQAAHIKRKKSTGLSLIKRNFILLGSVLLALHTPWSPPVLAQGEQTQKHWREFRQIIPGHFQDWVLAGNAPHFTLIYSEPPPAYNLREYTQLLKDTFRGYVSHKVQSQPLGYNGEVNDLIIELDYSFAKHARNALQQDLHALSTAIYGTIHGARFLELSTLLENQVTSKAPLPILISAVQLDDWLFGVSNRAAFISPELGLAGDLQDLLQRHKSGRFLSTDNSLVALLVDSTARLKFDSVTATRQFAIDSDFILGGVVDQQSGMVALIGRFRQAPLTDFPPLRVEDIFNAITAKDKNWAQSYDRTTPGAGQGEKGDWAPSYLSADLLDTEFGSLLNYADAVLKSQSLSDSVRYQGYAVNAFSDPPYPEGVFDHLSKKIGLSSLIFNFNTVGSGHWLEKDTGHRIYALNSTGSFGITYSPNITGQNSTLDGASHIDEAETSYTKWFSQQRSKPLVRTVQYMGIYQLFGRTEIGGPRLYPDRSEMFQNIGGALRESVKQGIEACLERSDLEDQKKLDKIDDARLLFTSISGYSSDMPPMPDSIDELKTFVSKAATAIRYEANLFGDHYRVLIENRNTLSTQSLNLFLRHKEQIEKYDRLRKKFDHKYGQYEIGKVPIYKNGKVVGTKTEYEIPPLKKSSFERDKRPLTELWGILGPVNNYLINLDERIETIENELDEIQTTFQSRDLLLGALKLFCSAAPSNHYVNNTLEQFAIRSKISHLRGADQFSIATPTIVISRVKDSFHMVGGHNVEIQHFKVRIDSDLPSGEYRFARGELSISPKDAPAVGLISRAMARVADADPGVQQRVFDSTLQIGVVPTINRQQALQLDVREVGALRRAAQGGDETIRAASPDIQPLLPVPDNAMVFGRDNRSGRLYFERPGIEGKRVKALIFGSNLSPELISRASVNNKGTQEIVTVVMDPSLSSKDVDALVSNYLNARTSPVYELEAAASGAGGGWRKPPGSSPPSIGGASPDGSRMGPRMVIFEDARTGRRRAVIETDRGRMELLIGRNADSDQILSALKTQIESEAELTLKPTTAHQNRLGTTFLLTKFQIQQSAAIDGKLVAKAKDKTGVFGRIIKKLRQIFAGTFKSVREGPELNNQLSDYIIEVKRQVESELPEWEIVGKIRIGETGMRFVFFEISPRVDRNGWPNA